MLNPDNPWAKEHFNLSNERWADYTPYEKALVDLEYKIAKSEAGHVLAETGPSKEAHVAFHPEKVVGEENVEKLLKHRGDFKTIIFDYGQGTLKKMVEADDVVIYLDELDPTTLKLHVSPTNYPDAH